MKQIVKRIKPSSGFGKIFHALSLVLLPAALYILARIGFIELAIVLIFLSKWRVFAVKPRYWAAHIRANMVDLFVGLSAVSAIFHTHNQWLQLMFAALYAVWLIVIKPKSSHAFIALQALIAQTVSLFVIYWVWGDRSTFWLVAGVVVVCVFTARHFLTIFDEAMSKMIAYIWGYLAGCVAWLTGHWLIFYGPVAQPVMLISIVGYGLASLYYLQYKDRLSVNAKRQVVAVLCAVAFIIILFSGKVDTIIQ